MDVSVEIGDGVAIPSPTTETPQGHAAGLAVREELTKIASDAAHPMHDGYVRGERSVMDHIQKMYGKAYPSTGPEPDSIGTATPPPDETPEQAEVRARNEVIMAPLRREWGGKYDARFMRAVGSARTLFGGEGWTEVFEDLGATIRQEYGPAGETAAIRFLDALSALKQHDNG